MRTTFIVVLVGCVSPGFLGHAAAQDKLDPAKLVGTWKCTSSEKSGQKSDGDSFKDGKITITKNTITLEFPVGTFVQKYALDATKKPVAISLTMADGGEAGAKAEGIIELKGDEIKLCYAQSGPAPKEFATKEGTDHRLIVLKRAGQEKQEKKGLGSAPAGFDARRDNAPKGKIDSVTGAHSWPVWKNDLYLVAQLLFRE